MYYTDALEKLTTSNLIRRKGWSPALYVSKAVSGKTVKKNLSKMVVIPSAAKKILASAEEVNISDSLLMIYSNLGQVRPFEPDREDFRSDDWEVVKPPK